ncbi:MAG: hypothetical protein DME58_06795 [Verrucomicrobia bacterium]|nr:MAG: hypothetical protein DME58_06795 [Verrucomicrobiota bacterium]
MRFVWLNVNVPLLTAFLKTRVQLAPFVFFSLGDGVCASAAPPLAKSIKRQTHICTANVFIPMPIIRRRGSMRI